MAIRRLPDPDLLRKLIEYRPGTGELIWKSRPAEMFAKGRFSQKHSCDVWNTKNAGNLAFNHRHGRHLAGSLFTELHLAHRIAWAVHYGVSEFGFIDHIDGDARNNRIRNLRLASPEINTQNAKLRDDNVSGVTGVNWHIGRYGKPRWVARIQCGNRRIHLGGFFDFDEAVRVRREAEDRYGFGPVHGKARKNG